MKKNNIIALSIVSLVVLGIIIYAVAGEAEHTGLMEVEAKNGRFEILVTTTGELQAENFEVIQGPIELRSRNIRIQNVRIQDLVPEGTVVSEGDWVATLDRSEADNTLKDMEDAVQREEAAFMKTQLDTTLTMSSLRDELINLEFALEERRLTLEQSKYEPPATIRQAEINLERAERNLEQAKQNYELRHQQALENMTEARLSLERQRRRYVELRDVLDKFTITAPSDGMVIYHREWGGQKRTVGSYINPRDLTVATLPDLSSMISRTYVNEIDISKVRVGQPVRIGVDAFPGQSYTGEVTQVANVGQQLPNTDARVFEVTIRLNENDDILRPAMTTSNIVVTNSFENVTYLPLETIHIADSIPYVYKRGGTRQIVVLGESNDNNVIIDHGIEPGDRVYLSAPSDPERFRLEGEELIDIIAERLEERRREEQERRERREEERARQEQRLERMRQMRTETERTDERPDNR